MAATCQPEDFRRHPRGLPLAVLVPPSSCASGCHDGVVAEAGRTQLHNAALRNDEAAARERLDAGDDPNASDPEGFTPLHLAAQENAVDVARLLLGRGAEVDRVNA